jgi:hypothetical protein
MIVYPIWASRQEGATGRKFLMATLENATHPKAFANFAKHLAFARSSELSVYGMVELKLQCLSELLS